nr:hypothetical protein Iba_chr07bCG2380 [Ipomoea batatas]GMD96281.1 hypothetical protein Iba_chr15bCG3260 [Ipomoea batatas]GMD96282.1 hypothetical protein Iba_chr15bCG3270 [Ipomoea batatas]GME13465.1 hypothetical protein Iba_scaffold14513CG0010 [Ipomoea batatas]
MSMLRSVATLALPLAGTVISTALNTPTSNGFNQLRFICSPEKIIACRMRKSSLRQSGILRQPLHFQSWNKFVDGFNKANLLHQIRVALLSHFSA